MPAITLFGRISAISLLVALQAATHAQPAAPANVPLAPSIEATLRTQTEEQKADLLMVEQQYQAAVEAYARVPQPSASVWNKMGIARQMLFDPKGAARCYKESLKLDPGNSNALNNLATLDDARADFAAAERLYRKALAVNPNSARTLKNLGTNLILQRRFRESSDAYARALALDPQIFNPHLGVTTETPVSIKVRGTQSYLRARSCARAGLNGCAIDQLRNALNEGAATARQVASDDDFGSLRQNPEFERLLAEQQ
jgi:tetratricopeptide (TPR) repeat protein